MHCLLTPALALMMHFKGQRLVDKTKRELKERVARSFAAAKEALVAAKASGDDEATAAAEEAVGDAMHDESEPEFEDAHEQLLASATQMQRRLAAVLTTLLTITSFGMLVPFMLLLAPLTMLLNLRARQWIAAHSEERSFGVLVAEQILVHPPIFLIRNLGFGLNILIMAFVFLDMEVGFAT